MSDSMDISEDGGNIEEVNKVQTPEDRGDFKIIGNVNKVRLAKVKTNLPKWMSESTKFNGNIETNSGNVVDLETIVDKKLIENLQKNGFNKLFPVQKAVIPYLVKSFNRFQLIQPSDVCVLSPTGSGKTLAYVIPIINHLLNRTVTQIRALVILPVSDLANQVFKVFQTICKNTTLRVGLATSSSKMNKSNDAPMFYRKNVEENGYICLVDILVATPGKLIDLIQRGNGFKLKDLEILVIDEADRMMNETQFQWLREIEYSVFESNAKQYCHCSIKKSNLQSSNYYNIDALSPCSIFDSSFLKKSIHKILFSATISTDPEKIDTLSLYRPILFNHISDKDDFNTDSDKSPNDPKQMIPLDLNELMVIIDEDKKPLVVWHLFKALKYRKILCFTDSIDSTHRLYQLMKQFPGIVVTEFSSKQNIKKRTKILSKFKDGLIDMIISTDIFARGLDITGINCVICYDPPRNETAYIHRIGRTARAGNEGTALTIITPDQLKHFTIVSRRAHKGDRKQINRLTLKNSDLKPLMPEYKEALRLLEKDVKVEQKVNYFKKQQQITVSKFGKPTKKLDKTKQHP